MQATRVSSLPPPLRSRRLPDLPWASLAIVTALGICAVFADTIAPHDPLATSLPDGLKPPVFQSGDWAHILGTDELGRDILSRLIHGARVSILLGGVSLAIGASIGIIVGLIAGYAGGFWEIALMRLTDLTLSYPVVLLALLLAVARGPRTTNIIIAISLLLWARFARVVRGDVLQIKEELFVEGAVTIGASPVRVLLRHILPNLAGTITVLLALQMGWVILIEASLSFIGAGVPPPAPAWGTMAALGLGYVVTAWWMTAMPGLAIMLAVLALNLLGDWLRDQLDPRLYR